MVGSFGEVQVMDWGLAKVLPRGGAVVDAKAGKERPRETLFSTARSGADTDLSHAGSILCEILTGTPAYTGRSSMEILRNPTASSPPRRRFDPR